MKIKKNKYFYCSILLIIVLGWSPAAWSMNDPEEYRIPTVALQNGSWENSISDQGDSATCCSHAVVDCLKYIHKRDHIRPFYLHKQAHYHYGTKDNEGEPAYRHYNTGHTVKNLMNFARDYGVPEIRDRTPNYAFQYIFSVNEIGNGDTFSLKIKDVLRKKKHPIVISVMSSQDFQGWDKEIQKYKTLCTNRLFTEIVRKIPDRLLEKNPKICCDQEEHLPRQKDNYHAVTVYGYSDREKGFLIKNSWGRGWEPGFRSHGKAILPYDYIERYGDQDQAYLGYGIKPIWPGYEISKFFLFGPIPICVFSFCSDLTDLGTALYPRPDIAEHIQSPISTGKYAHLLKSMDPNEKEKAVGYLLGYPTGYPTWWGYIEYLWWSHKHQTGKHENLVALSKRMERFKVPDDKYIVLQNHICIVKLITNNLLNAIEENSPVHKNILNNSRQKGSISNFLIHLSKLNQDEQSLIRDLGTAKESAREFLQSFKNWLGDEKDGKGSWIKKMYRL